MTKLISILTILLCASALADIGDVASLKQRTDGKFDVECKDGRREIRTAGEIQKGEVCLKVVPPPVIKPGKIPTKVWMQGDLGHGLVLSGGRLAYVYYAGNEASSYEGLIYDTINDRWSQLSVPKHAALLNSATVISDGDHTLYFIGGHAGERTPLKSAFRFDLVTSQLTALADLPKARFTPPAIVGKNGKVYVFGGSDYDTYGYTKGILDVDVYDPATKAWTTGAPLRQFRSNGEAHLLPDGRIFLMGGYKKDSPNPWYGLSYGVEVYDPSVDKWSDFPSFPAPFKDYEVSRNSVVVLRDSSVLHFAKEGTEVWALDASHTRWALWSKGKRVSRSVPVALLSSVDERVYLIGGAHYYMDEEDVTHSWRSDLVEVLEPRDEKWSQGDYTPPPKIYPIVSDWAAALPGDKLWMQLPFTVQKMSCTSSGPCKSSVEDTTFYLKLERNGNQVTLESHAYFPKITKSIFQKDGTVTMSWKTDIGSGTQTPAESYAQLVLLKDGKVQMKEYRRNQTTLGTGITGGMSFSESFKGSAEGRWNKQ